MNDYTDLIVSLLSTFAALSTLPVAILWDAVETWHTFWWNVYVQESQMWGRVNQ